MLDIIAKHGDILRTQFTLSWIQFRHCLCVIGSATWNQSPSCSLSIYPTAFTPSRYICQTLANQGTSNQVRCLECSSCKLAYITVSVLNDWVYCISHPILTELWELLKQGPKTDQLLRRYVAAKAALTMSAYNYQARGQRLIENVVALARHGIYMKELCACGARAGSHHSLCPAFITTACHQDKRRKWTGFDQTMQKFIAAQFPFSTLLEAKITEGQVDLHELVKLGRMATYMGHLSCIHAVQWTDYAHSARMNFSASTLLTRCSVATKKIFAPRPALLSQLSKNVH